MDAATRWVIEQGGRVYWAGAWGPFGWAKFDYKIPTYTTSYLLRIGTVNFTLAWWQKDKTSCLSLTWWMP